VWAIALKSIQIQLFHREGNKVMQMQWWQSIRGRLGLGSVLLALLTTTMLALTAMMVINYYYGVDQRDTLSQMASEKVSYVDKYFAQNPMVDPRSNLAIVAQLTLKPSPNDDQQYWMIVFNASGIPIYPSFPNNKASFSPSLITTVPAQKVNTAQVRATALARGISLPDLRATAKAQSRERSSRARTLALHSVLQLVNLSIQPSDFDKFQKAIVEALSNRDRRSTDEQFGYENPFGQGQPFSVRSIVAGTKVVGALLMTPRSNVVPPFVTTVGMAVLIASIVIIILAVLAAIFFSRPITIPLTNLTIATRQLARGDYSVQVSTKAPGELGELSRNFNEMAAQLKRDVEELQRQEIWRRELIMNITHDLATPLTAIAGLGEALIDGVNHNLEDYEATGRVIVRETLRLHRLVQDLHVMAKLDAKAAQPKKKSIRLAALVDEVLAVLAADFERGGVEPINSIRYDLAPVQADADLLTRVFSNLCSNSLRHTPPGGYVIIEAVEHNGWLVISVTDTGEGIPEEALSRVFERFYRVEKSRQSSTGGSGLGLAIVRAIIEAHGGIAWVENVSGAGARISFTLPLFVDDQVSLHDIAILPCLNKTINASKKEVRSRP
jgi:signal transduction histidine kinase